MASLREQIIGKVIDRIEDVMAALNWTTFVRNPRNALGEDEMNAIVLMDGEDFEPSGLTGHVEERRIGFTVVLWVIEPKDGSARFETLLDVGLVAVCDALLDPANIQFDGLAVGIDQGAIGEPGYGRSQGSARIMAALPLDFSIRYWAREGDASATAF